MHTYMVNSYIIVGIVIGLISVWSESQRYNSYLCFYHIWCIVGIVIRALLCIFVCGYTPTIIYSILVNIFIMKSDSLLRGASNRKTNAIFELCVALRSYIVSSILTLCSRRVLTACKCHLDEHVYLHVDIRLLSYTAFWCNHLPVNAYIHGK